MVLSQRLTAVAMLVTQESRLADIGTDHAFVRISLVEEGRIPSALAMDVNKGPLERAKEHIRMHGLEEYIETRLSDGLDLLKPGEADTVLIAGMGGALTIRILAKRPGLTGEIRELIVQPQSEIAAVRRFLGQEGWKIVQERMVREDGKYYQMMRCLPGIMDLNEAQAQYGPCLMTERSPVWMEYVLWRQEVLERNLSSILHAQGDRSLRRREEILHDLETARELVDPGS